MNRLGRVVCLGLVLGLGLVWGASAEIKPLVILHTNDLHDHLRPDYDGVGGLAYVSGYIKGVKAECGNVLVLDGGDVMEKGDLVCFRTQSEVMYEAMGRIGYDAGAVGNHDDGYGVPHMLECAKLAGNTAFLCANVPEGSGLEKSKVFEAGGIKVGVIGLTRMEGVQPFFNEEAGKALAQESARLAADTDFQVVVCHFGTSDCAKFSKAAPEVDVFVSGHTHEATQSPKLVANTGAIIVQAGEYAQYVGRLDLKVDVEGKKLAGYEGKLVKMVHSEVKCDEEMQAWAMAREQAVCPEASLSIGHADRSIMNADATRLAAAALRWQGQVDIGFCHPGQVTRSGLPAGDLDVNALFRTGGQRGDKLVMVSLEGALINQYLEGLKKEEKGDTEWVGFRGKLTFDEGKKVWRAKTDLDPAKVYRVVMPALEWDSRFVKVVQGNGGPIPAVEPCSFSFIDAFTGYAKWMQSEHITLDKHADDLRKDRELK